MRGPHAHGSLVQTEGRDWANYDRCRFCGTPMDQIGWSLCDKSPEVFSFPKVGEVWELPDGHRSVRSMVTAVRPNGDWNWGHSASGTSFYAWSPDKKHSRPQWPPEGGRQIYCPPYPEEEPPNPATK